MQSGMDASWRERLALELGAAGERRRRATRRVVNGFFAAHLCCTFSFQLWSFAAPVILISLFPGDLLPPSACLVVDYIFKIWALPAVVAWATAQQNGGRTRLVVLQILCAAQAALACSSAGTLLLLRVVVSSPPPRADAIKTYSVQEIAVAFLAVVFGSASDVGGSATKIMHEKDWVFHVSAATDLQACAACGHARLPSRPCADALRNAS